MQKDTLFAAIAHGDAKHRAWLSQAIEDHFAGRPVAKPDVNVPAVPRKNVTNIDWTNIRAIQHEITRWAEETFPHRTDHHAIYKLMVDEIPEMMTHMKEKGQEGVGLELADCFVLLLDVASMWGVDIADAIQEKMATNYLREWDIDNNGIAQHKVMPERKPVCHMSTSLSLDACPDYPDCPCGDPT